MKGRFYIPTYSNNSPQLSPRPLHRKKTIRYYWQNSIPDTWNKLIEKNHIPINTNTRKTLQFLKETEQYIYQIAKPIKLDHLSEKPEIKLSPRSNHSIDPPKYLSGSQSQEFYPRKKNSIIKLKKLQRKVH